MWTYVLPRRLFTCTVIRTLCVASCRLKLPAAVNLPLLETLSITAPHYDSGRSIQRLISSCPRLIDLTLEAIYRLKRVSVLDKRLRRFALRCCHNLKSVDIDASELRSLDYCGTVPAESLLSLHGLRGVPSCTVDFCIALSQEAEFTRFRGFMEKISDAKYLHLHNRSLESMFFLGFPSFSSLTRLVLQGPLDSCGIVVSVGRILEQTPNLEILSLCMEERVKDTQDQYGTMGEEYEDDVVEKEKDGESDDLFVAPDEFTVPDEASFSMPCLRHRVNEINMVHYVGDETQRMMARLLFRNALVLERMCVVLVKGTFELQSKLKNEIDSWVVADVEKIFL
uniref:F-box/LRR-repeat protein 15/At3g58940/PEG3-like LRR domain-containing protein n=1 Tax=Aegilops tauschii subsp. strangulata TaxID=200361 RepID=A0A453D3Q2_AEGTS